MKFNVFTCRRCMHCCFFTDESECPVIFSWERIKLEELAEKLGIDLSLNTQFKPLEVYRRGGLCIVLLYRWVINGFCPFYDVALRSCRVHKEKPYACKVYPLLVEVPSGRLSVSGHCTWVSENMWVCKRGDLLPHVFPNEFEIAKRIFVEYMSALQVLQEEGFRRVDSIEGCGEVIGFEEFIERG